MLTVNVDSNNKNPNQFHLLACEPDWADASGWTSAGTVTSWTWQPGVGWAKAQGLQGFRHVVGFGYRASVTALVEKVDEFLSSRRLSQSSWQDAVQAIPSLQKLIPIDFAAFEQALERRGLTLLAERDGTLAQVGRLA
jgi:hypothetical protein